MAKERSMFVCRVICKVFHDVESIRSLKVSNTSVAAFSYLQQTACSAFNTK